MTLLSSCMTVDGPEAVGSGVDGPDLEADGAEGELSPTARPCKPRSPFSSRVVMAKRHKRWWSFKGRAAFFAVRGERAGHRSGPEDGGRGAYVRQSVQSPARARVM